MDIPHIYRPVDLFLGLLMLVAGVPLFGRELFRFRKRPFRTWVQNGQLSFISLFLVTNGLLYVSRAFDPPHRESSLTNSLQWGAIAEFAVMVALEFFARRLQRSQPEHTAGKMER